MVDLYAIFHGNLQFSSISKSQYKEVIDNCYWPLIKILEKNKGLKLGIEFSGLTLLEINKIDKRLIDKIKQLITGGQIELIGSAYTQAIFPLIPFDVNLRNLELGKQVYKKIFGFIPKTFYVNEQTFSDGVISIYKRAGIKNIIVDFDSTAEKVRNNKTLLFNPVKIKDQKGQVINVIWNSSILFQKFQRYIFDENSYDDYIKYLKETLFGRKKGSLCLYGSDWEVFGFSPKGIKRDTKNDYIRLDLLFKNLSQSYNARFVLPSDLLKQKIVPLRESITDFTDPILSKKQEKYNVSRWALAGKNTIFRNTACFKLNNQINLIKTMNRADEGDIQLLEKNLVVLWGSDFRTNTTNDKNKDFENLLFQTNRKILKYIKQERGLSSSNQVKRQSSMPLPENGKVETEYVKLTLDCRKGATIKELVFPKIFSKNIAGLIPHGHFQNPRLSPDWFSACCVFEAEDNKKYTDLSRTEIFIDEINNNNLIKLTAKLETAICFIEKQYLVYTGKPQIDLTYNFIFKKVSLKSARIESLAFSPMSFDINNFWYSVSNGGKAEEVYKMNGKSIYQESLISPRISSRGCLGATEGWISAGDKHKGLLLTWDQSEMASCPILHFESTQQGFFGQIYHSFGESDETGFPTFDGKYKFSVSIIGIPGRSVPKRK